MTSSTVSDADLHARRRAVFRAVLVPPGPALPDRDAPADGGAEAGAGRVALDGGVSWFAADGLLEWIEWQNAGQFADAAACGWLALLRCWRAHEGRLPESAPPAQPRWIDAVARASGVRAAWLGAGLDAETRDALAEPGMGVPTDPKHPGRDAPQALLRAAAFGMVPGLEDRYVTSFARQSAVLTHGHPSTWVASAVQALLVAHLLRGAELPTACEAARAWLGESAADAGADVRRAWDATVLPALQGTAPAEREPAAGSAEVLCRAVVQALAPGVEPGGRAQDDAVTAVLTAQVQAAAGRRFAHTSAKLHPEPGTGEAVAAELAERWRAATT
ncbi:MAG: ADP-ribosylglycohydrolase family protein [Micrococcus sp.]|nr:ADP-ribosylglycohydrolase family protein [Micrococcus sp.]